MHIFWDLVISFGTFWLGWVLRFPCLLLMILTVMSYTVIFYLSIGTLLKWVLGCWDFSLRNKILVLLTRPRKVPPFSTPLYRVAHWECHPKVRPSRSDGKMLILGESTTHLSWAILKGSFVWKRLNTNWVGPPPQKKAHFLVFTAHLDASGWLRGCLRLSPKYFRLGLLFNNTPGCSPNFSPAQIPFQLKQA